LELKITILNESKILKLCKNKTTYNKKIKFSFLAEGDKDNFVLVDNAWLKNRYTVEGATKAYFIGENLVFTGKSILNIDNNTESKIPEFVKYKQINDYLILCGEDSYTLYYEGMRLIITDKNIVSFDNFNSSFVKNSLVIKDNGELKIIEVDFKKISAKFDEMYEGDIKEDKIENDLIFNQVTHEPDAFSTKVSTFYTFDDYIFRIAKNKITVHTVLDKLLSFPLFKTHENILADDKIFISHSKQNTCVIHFFSKEQDLKEIIVPQYDFSKYNEDDHQDIFLEIS